MIALALALLLQQAPAVERGSGYEFVRPKGWLKKEQGKTTTLTPPGGKREVRLILYPMAAVSDGTYSTEAHFHVAMLQALTGDSEKLGEPVTGKTGAFQWSRQKLNVDGTEHRVAAYTAKLRSHWGLVAFAGPADEFEKHLAAVEQFVKDLRSEAQGKAVAAGAHEIHGLKIPLPDGWSRKDHDGGAIELQPPDKGFAINGMILVLPTQPLQGTFWESHRKAFDEVVKAFSLKKTVAPAHEPDSPGPFIRSSTAGDDANGSVRAIRLYSALSEGGIECVVVYGSEDFAVTGPMLHGSKVRKPPKEAPRPKIVGAWRRLSQQTHVEYNQGRQLIIPVPYDRIVLRSDGLADFSPIHREGCAASPAVAKADATVQNGRYGSWKAVGEKEVHIVRKSDRPAEVYVRDGANLRLGDKVYEPMPSVDGVTLEGRWHLPGAVDRKRRIEFTSSGRFKDDGLLEDVGHLPVLWWTGGGEVRYPRPPSQGEGTYEIREFTLLLKYEDGTVWSADFSTYGADGKDLSKLLLKTGELHRE